MNLDPAIGVFLDGLIAVLLLATIATGLFLNRRIERLRKSTADINGLVGGFDKATARAKAGVEALRVTLRETGGQLQDQINVARGLRDDLRQMAVAGGRVPGAERREPKAVIPKIKSFPKAEPKGMPKAEAILAEPKGIDTPAKPAIARGARPAGMSRATAAAMAAAATQEASEVERELRELLRHVR